MNLMKTKKISLEKMIVCSFHLLMLSRLLISLLPEFEDELNTYKEKFDFIICDTPPWELFDAKIISKHFDLIIYVVNSKLSLKIFLW